MDIIAANQTFQALFHFFPPYRRYAQTFTIAAAAQLNKVAIPLRFMNAPTAPETLFVEIRLQDGNGKPGALVATSVNSIDVYALTAGVIWYDFQFANELLEPGIGYTVIIRSDSDTSPNHVYVSTLSTGAAAGQGMYYTPSTQIWSNYIHDLAYAAYGSPPPPSDINCTIQAEARLQPILLASSRPAGITAAMHPNEVTL